MFSPISEQSFVNVLPSRFVRPEGLNNFFLEMYLVLFWRLPNFISRLHDNTHPIKSLAFSSWLLPLLTGFVGVPPFDINSPLFTVHATTTKCKTIAFTPIFHAKIVGFNWLAKLGSVEVNDVIKVGGIKNSNFSDRYHFSRLRRSQLAAPPSKLYSACLQYRQWRRL